MSVYDLLDYFNEGDFAAIEIVDSDTQEVLYSGDDFSDIPSDIEELPVTLVGAYPFNQYSCKLIIDVNNI